MSNHKGFDGSKCNDAGSKDCHGSGSGEQTIRTEQVMNVVKDEVFAKNQSESAGYGKGK